VWSLELDARTGKMSPHTVVRVVEDGYALNHRPLAPVRSRPRPADRHPATSSREPKMPFHKVIDIDLGTTYSAVSIWDGREIQVIESPFGAKTVPSVVGLDPEGQVIVGAPAQRNRVVNPANTVIEVKREMGVYERAPRDADDLGEPRYIRFRDRDYLPQEISAFILMTLKLQAENFIGEPIHDAVITVPAYF